MAQQYRWNSTKTSRKHIQVHFQLLLEHFQVCLFLLHLLLFSWLSLQRKNLNFGVKGNFNLPAADRQQMESLSEETKDLRDREEFYSLVSKHLCPGPDFFPDPFLCVAPPFCPLSKIWRLMPIPPAWTWVCTICWLLQVCLNVLQQNEEDILSRQMNMLRASSQFSVQSILTLLSRSTVANLFCRSLLRDSQCHLSPTPGWCSSQHHRTMPQTPEKLEQPPPPLPAMKYDISQMSDWANLPLHSHCSNITKLAFSQHFLQISAFKVWFSHIGVFIHWTHVYFDAVLNPNKRKTLAFFLASSCSFLVMPFLMFILPMLNIFSLFSDMFCKNGKKWPRWHKSGLCRSRWSRPCKWPGRKAPMLFTWWRLEVKTRGFDRSGLVSPQDDDHTQQERKVGSCFSTKLSQRSPVSHCTLCLPESDWYFIFPPPPKQNKSSCGGKTMRRTRGNCGTKANRFEARWVATARDEETDNATTKQELALQNKFSPKVAWCVRDVCPGEKECLSTSAYSLPPPLYEQESCSACWG